MTFVHGKDTFLSVAGDDISQYCNTSELSRGADSHDVTTYGKKSHVFAGGLLKGDAKVEGVYDNTVSTGPRALFRPIIGTVVPLVRRPEGTGTGKPQDTVNVLIEEYVETNPVADMVTWSVKLTCSDDVVSITQP